jgi:hypothetical protein
MSGLGQNSVPGSRRGDGDKVREDMSGSDAAQGYARQEKLPCYPIGHFKTYYVTAD